MTVISKQVENCKRKEFQSKLVNCENYKGWFYNVSSRLMLDNPTDGEGFYYLFAKQEMDTQWDTQYHILPLYKPAVVSDNSSLAVPRKP